MVDHQDFVVVARDAVEREVAGKQTPRRPTDEDRRRRREVVILCRACHDWLVYNPGKDVQERMEPSTRAGGPPTYVRFVKCVCGADRVIGLSSESAEDRAKRVAEFEARQAARPRTCSECGTMPADHYCKTCDKFFCVANGCGAGEHPTTYQPQLLPALEKVDSREALQQVLKPLRDEHDKHSNPLEHPACPFCTGDIT